LLFKDGLHPKSCHVVATFDMQKLFNYAAPSEIKTAQNTSESPYYTYYEIASTFFTMLLLGVQKISLCMLTKHINCRLHAYFTPVSQ
jgi:hypothetical protein